MTPQEFIAKWGAPNGVPGPAYALNEVCIGELGTPL